MAFARYMVRYSYIGTSLRGVQLNSNLNYASTIVGNIALALQQYKLIRGSLIPSSRTDAGVHALNASAHFDLAPWNGSYPYGSAIARNLNRYFHKNERSITINEIRRVPIDFHSRFNAKSRTYLYRLVYSKKENDGKEIHLPTPIEEWKRIFYVKKVKVDVDKLREALKLFEGVHDFETFKKYIPNNPWKHSVRRIDSINVDRGFPMVTSYNLDKFKNLEYLDIKIKGKAFVHNQVRRMVATGLAAAANKIDLSEIRLMLTIPSKNSWNSKINTVPPHGLYLCDVEYDENDLIFEDEINQTDKYIDCKNQS